LSRTMYALLVIGGLNTVVSAMYYIKVLKVMIIDKRLEEVEGRPVEPLPAPWLVKGYAGILAAVVVGLGVFWNNLNGAARDTGVNGFFPATRTATEPTPDEGVEEGRL
jgi:NADH:ubiquinone oxidoreductase subunit 2 (subunit N)